MTQADINTQKKMQARLIAAQEKVRQLMGAVSGEPSPEMGSPQMQMGGYRDFAEMDPTGIPDLLSTLSQMDMQGSNPHELPKNEYANYMDQFLPEGYTPPTKPSFYMGSKALTNHTQNTNQGAPKSVSDLLPMLSQMDMEGSEQQPGFKSFNQEIPLNGYASIGRLAAPVFNTVAGLMPANQHDVSQLMNRKTVTAPKININPELEAATRGYTNAAQSVGVTGQSGDAMNFANSLTATKAATDARIYQHKYNQEAVLGMQADQVNAQIEAQNKGMKFSADETNFQHQAMKETMLATAAGQVSDFSQAALDNDVNMGYVNGLSDIYDYSFPVRFGNNNRSQRKNGGFFSYKPRFLSA